MQAASATATSVPNSVADGGAARSRRVGRPSASEAALKHEAMLEAALEEFSRHGYHGASIRAIAERAGLSTRTLYNRYTDKIALFAACLEMSAQQDAWGWEGEGSSLREELTLFSTHMQVRLNQDQPIRLARVIYRECTSFPQLEVVSRHQFERFQLEPVQAILEGHRFPAALARELGKLYVSMAFQPLQSRIIYDERPMTGAEISAHVETVTDLFLNGAQALSRDT